MPSIPRSVTLRPVLPSTTITDGTLVAESSRTTASRFSCPNGRQRKPVPRQRALAPSRPASLGTQMHRTAFAEAAALASRTNSASTGPNRRLLRQAESAK